MKKTVQNKLTHLKSLSKASAVSRTISVRSVRSVNDSLSKSIRTKKDADIFRKELNTAFQLAKK